MIVLLSALVLAASPPPASPAPATPDRLTAPTPTPTTMVRGEKLKGLPKVELAALLKDPSASEGKAVTLEGKVRKACEKKGCWMELASEAKGPGVRVTFKDYGFFVPLDAAGSRVKIEGVISLKELSEERVKHYEGEGATITRGKDGKAREVQLVASGLELYR